MRKSLLFNLTLLTAGLLPLTANADTITHDFNNFAGPDYYFNANLLYDGLYVAKSKQTSEVTPASGVISGLAWGANYGAYGIGGFYLGPSAGNYTYFMFYAHEGPMSFHLGGYKNKTKASYAVYNASWNGSAFELDLDNPLISDEYDYDTYPTLKWQTIELDVPADGWVVFMADCFNFDNLTYTHTPHTVVGTLKSTWGYPIDFADAQVHSAGSPYQFSTPVKVDNNGKFEIQFNHLETIESHPAPAYASTFSLSTQVPSTGYSVSLHRADFNAPVHIPFSIDDADENRIINLGDFTMGQGTMTGIDTAEASDVKVSVSGGDICISGNYETAEAYTLSGARTGLSSLPSGIYLVRVDGAAHKVIVK